MGRLASPSRSVYALGTGPASLPTTPGKPPSLRQRQPSVRVEQYPVAGRVQQGHVPVLIGAGEAGSRDRLLDLAPVVGRVGGHQDPAGGHEGNVAMTESDQILGTLFCGSAAERFGRVIRNGGEFGNRRSDRPVMVGDPDCFAE